MSNNFATIRIVDTYFDDFNEEFESALKENIIQRWLYCFGILELNRKKTLHRKLIVRYQKDVIELKLPPNNEYVSFERYHYITKSIIEEFKYKVDHLKKYRSLNNLLRFKTGVSNFNANKIFETIEYYIAESKKNCTPIIYTGMTNTGMTN